MIVSKDSSALLDQQDLFLKVSLMEVCVFLVNIVQQDLELQLVVMLDLTVETIYWQQCLVNVQQDIIAQEEVKINIQTI